MTAGILTRTGRLRQGRSRPVLRPLVVFTAVVIVAFFAMTYSRISLDRAAFELHGIEQELAAQERAHWDMRLELARLQDPRRITEAAAGLGLVYPQDRITVEAPGMGGDAEAGISRWTASRSLLTELP
jgi:hypothetical protein